MNKNSGDRMKKSDKRTRGAATRRAWSATLIRDAINHSYSHDIEQAAAHFSVPIGNLGRWRKQRSKYFQEAAKVDAAALIGLKYKKQKELKYRLRATSGLRPALDTKTLKAVEQQSRMRRTVSIKFVQRVMNKELKRLEDIGTALCTKKGCLLYSENMSYHSSFF